MRRPGGQLIITSEFSCVEIDTFTCGHCNTIHPVRPKEKPEDVGGLCYVCWALVCPNCVGGGCDPLEEKLKRAEMRAVTLRSYGFG